MDRQAKVTSVDALTAFRSSLVIYMSSVGNALDEVRDEVRRMRTWLQVDQRSYWGGQLKRLRKQLEQAEAELFTSRLSAMTSHSAARQMAVTRLRRKVRESEERAKVLQKWIRNYDTLVEPLLKKLDGMQHFAAHDLPKAAAEVAQAERTLDDYTRIAPEGESRGGSGDSGSGEDGGAATAGEEGGTP
tara:strand:+ start:1042 stop:1605 length:564 start_codon:yes stop_codon:yes gene_type:complete